MKPQHLPSSNSKLLGIGGNHFSEKRLQKINTGIVRLLGQDGARLPKTPETVFLDIPDLMALLEVSRRTVGHWCRTSALPFVRIRGKCYFRLREVMLFLEKLSLKGSGTFPKLGTSEKWIPTNKRDP